MLRMAASIAGHAPVILGDTITGLDDRNIQILVRALIHTSGQRQFPPAPLSSESSENGQRSHGHNRSQMGY